jgi:hypothetical protein
MIMRGILPMSIPSLSLVKEITKFKLVYLDPYWYLNHIRRSDANWEEKLGRALGNLQSLTTSLTIAYGNGRDQDPEEEPPDWETVGRVLRHVWQKITLDVRIWPAQGSEEAFARAIRGHPTIQRFVTERSFHFESFGIIASALATLPALESAWLWRALLEDDDDLEDQPTMEHPEHMTTLLLSQSLRSVEFGQFYFPNSVCQAVALALKTGSPITCLKLTHCNFSEGGGGAIVHALQRNSTLKTLSLVLNELDDGICDALTPILRVNTTLTVLRVLAPWQFGSTAWLRPFFDALRMNTSLKRLDVSYLFLLDELACGALHDVFAKNSVLEELTLFCGDDYLPGDMDVVPWRTTLSFLLGNTTLKTFTLFVNGEVTDPHIATLFIDIAAMLEDTISLECLDTNNLNHGFSPENYFRVLVRLQTNTTLKTLRLDFNSAKYLFDDNAAIKHLISLVKKNYGLENMDVGLSAQEKRQENSVPSCD